MLPRFFDPPRFGVFVQGIRVLQGILVRLCLGVKNLFKTILKNQQKR